jgi:hypothetical protein
LASAPAVLEATGVAVALALAVTPEAAGAKEAAAEATRTISKIQKGRINHR